MSERWDETELVYTVHTFIKKAAPSIIITFNDASGRDCCSWRTSARWVLFPSISAPPRGSFLLHQTLIAAFSNEGLAPGTISRKAMPFALVQLLHPLNNLAAEVRPWRIVPARLITTSTNTVARSHFLGQAHSSAKDTTQSQASLRRAKRPPHRPFSMPTIRHGSTSSAPRPGAGGGSKERPPPSAPRPSSR